MSSYNHSLPRIWGAAFLYQHHMTWGSTSCLLTGHLSDLIGIHVSGQHPPHTWLGLQNQPCPRALHLAPTFQSSPTPLSAPAAWTWRSLLCHTQNLFPLCSLLGAAPYFPFSEWPCECLGTYSDSPENLRLVAKSKRQRQPKHSKDKILKDASQSSAISGLLSFPYPALLFFLGFWLIHFLPIWYFYLFIYLFLGLS